MVLTFEDRPSPSPFVERVWRSRSLEGGPFLSIAAGHVELCLTRLPHFAMVTLRGPETRPTLVDCPAHGEWVGIRFRAGTFLPRLPTPFLLDGRSVHMPLRPDGTFWLDGRAWEAPAYETAEALVARLAAQGIIARDRAVDGVLAGDRRALTDRSVQRHFQAAMGLTHGLYRQIERARYAAGLLRGGVGILDTVHAAGYFDQAHLTRAMRGLIGETPARLGQNTAQLSFLYKTPPPPEP